MEIEKGKTTSGNAYIVFNSDDGNKIVLANGGQQLRFVIKTDTNSEFAYLTQEQIQTLLPYLQAYAQTGQLEPQESTLQGDTLSVDFVKRVVKRYMNNYDAFDTCEAILRDLGLPEYTEEEAELATMQESGVAMAATIVEQGKRIKELENIVADQASRLKEIDNLASQLLDSQLFKEE